MRKDENAKEQQVNITGRRIWVTAIIINVIPILIKLFNVLSLNIHLEKNLIILTPFR